MPTCVDLYFDVISPYAFIAFEGILRYHDQLKAKNVELRLKPYLLGGVMKASGNRPPLMLPAKARYMPNDLLALSKYWGLDITLNPDFASDVIPNGTLLAQRFLTAIEQRYPKYLIPAARAFWQRVWSTHEPIHQKADICAVATKIGLPNVDEVLDLANSSEIKDVLKERTNEAIESGAFGAPWFIVRKGEEVKCYWGSDRLYLVLDELGIDFVGALKSKI